MSSSAAVSVEVLTVASHDEGYFQALQHSCQRHGLPLTVLGFGTPWGGFNTKFRLMLEALATRNPNDLVMFVDAFDVIILQDADVLVKRFLALTNGGKRVLFGVDNPQKDHSRKALVGLMYGGLCRSRNVNSGVYMGRVWLLQRMLSALARINRMDRADDQSPHRASFQGKGQT